MLQRIAIVFMALIGLNLSGCSNNATPVSVTGNEIFPGPVSNTIVGPPVTPNNNILAPGAIVGGLIGQSMDSSDDTHVTEGLSGGTYRSSSWVNPHTGIRYTLVPTTNKMTYHGNEHCRRFRVSATINDRPLNYYGVACKQTEGSWVGIAE